MNAISLEYGDLSNSALIKIFQIADILTVTPKEAAKIYLTAISKAASEKQTGPNTGRILAKGGAR